MVTNDVGETFVTAQFIHVDLL